MHITFWGTVIYLGLQQLTAVAVKITIKKKEIMRNSEIYTEQNSDNMFSALIDSVSERVAERICSRIEEKLQQTQQHQRSSQSLSLSSSADDQDQLITKAEACHFLDRCDSTLSKWAQRGILVPIRRGGQLYYRKADVMKMYKGEL